MMDAAELVALQCYVGKRVLVPAGWIGDVLGIEAPGLQRPWGCPLRLLVNFPDHGGLMYLTPSSCKLLQTLQEA